MTINPTEISDIIKDKIKNLDIKTQSHNEGTVVSLTDGIAQFMELQMLYKVKC